MLFSAPACWHRRHRESQTLQLGFSQNLSKSPPSPGFFLSPLSHRFSLYSVSLPSDVGGGFDDGHLNIMMRGQVVRRFTWTVVLQMAVKPLHQYITPSHQVEVLYALLVDNVDEVHLHNARFMRAGLLGFRPLSVVSTQSSAIPRDSRISWDRER